MAAGPITFGIVAGVCAYQYSTEIKAGIAYIANCLVDGCTSTITINLKDHNTHKNMFALYQYLNKKFNNVSHKKATDGSNVPEYKISSRTYSIRCGWVSYIHITVTDDSIVIWTLGRYINYLCDFLNTIYKEYNSPDDLIVFYTSNFADNKYNWSFPIFRRPRIINLTLDMQKVLEDVKTFLKAETEQAFKTKGIPYKRGYFIEGGPGTGKSAIIEAVAQEMGGSVYLTNMNSSSMSDTNLINLASTIPPRSVLAFDEIEKQYDAIKNNKKINISTGGILSALDGPQRLSHGTIIIMTANDSTNLDDDFKAALFRKGRIDKTFKFEDKFEA